MRHAECFVSSIGSPIFVSSVPAWCQRHLAFEGRGTFDTPDIKANRLSWLSAQSWRLHEEFLNCYDVQETHKARQRVLASSLEVFRQTHWTSRRLPKDAESWAALVRAWLGWYHQQRTKIADRPLRGTTMLSWFWTVCATLPVSIPKRISDAIAAGISSHATVRPDPQPRDERIASAAALSAASTQHDVRLWLATALIVRSGQRLTDATWVAGGWFIPGSLAITSTSFTAQPIMEKSDQLQIKIPEPMSMILNPEDRPRLIEWKSLPPLSHTALSALHRQTGATLRAAGLSDVRVPRRDRAMDISITHSKKAAGLLLRHAPGSVHTSLYTGPVAASSRMISLLQDTPHPVTPAKRGRPVTPTSSDTTSGSSSSPPRHPLKRVVVPSRTPKRTASPRTPSATMTGGRLSQKDQRALKRASSAAQEDASEQATRRLLGM